jgi:cAMP-dependent protein kinase regulator
MQLSTNLSHIDASSLLSRATIFSGIALEEQKLLSEKCAIAQYMPEELIIEQGEIGDRLFIIIKGTVQVSIKTLTSEWQRITTLGPGEVFGEIAILRNIPRTARISAITACQCLTINAQDFLGVYQNFSDRARDNIQLVVKKRLQGSGI